MVARMGRRSKADAEGDAAADEQAAREAQSATEAGDVIECRQCRALKGQPCRNPQTGVECPPHWSRTGRMPAPPKLERPKSKKKAKAAES